MADFNSITELPLKLTQNGLDYIAKQYQTIYDAYFGSENDNSEEPIITPLILNGFGVAEDNVWFYDASAPANYYACWFYDIHIDGDKSPETYFGTRVFDITTSHQRNSSITGSNLERCDAIAQSITNVFTVDVGSNFATPVTYQYHTESNPYLIHYTTFPNWWIDDIFNVTTGHRNWNSNHRIRTRRVDMNSSDWGMLSGSELYVNLLSDRMFFTNGTNDYLSNQIINNNTYHNETYTTISGDTITYYYNDTSVIIPSSGGGGIGIGGVGGVALAYVDIESIFGSLLDDVNISIGGGSDLYFPSYDEIKYGDRGSFWITPIEQLPTLPVAPDIVDTVIDVSEPLSMLSSGFGALLSCFDSLGVTLTLTFTFLSCLVINKLRGD